MTKDKTTQKRKEFLINQLHSMGVFYNGDKYIDIEELTLSELEYLHIEKKCEFVDIMIKQKGHSAPRSIAPGKFIPIN